MGEPTTDAGEQEPLSFDDLVADRIFTGAEYEKYLTACRLVVRQLGLRPGAQAVVVNGRVRASLGNGCRWDGTDGRVWAARGTYQAGRL